MLHIMLHILIILICFVRHGCLFPLSCVVNTNKLLCNGLNFKDIPSIEHDGSNDFDVFDISNNLLTKLYNNSFDKYVHLKEMYISRNDISVIEVGAFKNLHSLRVLDLSKNELMYIYRDLLINNVNLKLLLLHGNPLVYVQTNEPFLNSPSITFLNLSYCSILSLSEKSFTYLRNIERLDLSSNNLISLSPDVFSVMHNLHSLYLQGNIWDCSCQLGNLWRWVLSIRLLHSDMQTNMPFHCYAGPQSEKVWTDDEYEYYCNATEVKNTRTPSSSEPTEKHTHIFTNVVTSSKVTEDYMDIYTNVGSSSADAEGHYTNVELLEMKEFILDNYETRQSAFSNYQRNIISVLIVVLVLVTAIAAAFSCIKCLGKLFRLPQTYLVIRHKNESSSENLMNDHIYEYVL